MIEEDFVIKAYYIPLEKHLKILEKIKNKYKFNTWLEQIVELEDFENLPIQYRISPKSKDIGYIYIDYDDFYKVEYDIKKFIDWKSFLNQNLTMETE